MNNQVSNKAVAVIILNWNGEAMLRRFLPSVLKHTPEWIADVIVADNGSTDGSLELLKEQFPSVTVIKLSKNYGFAEGYNRAIGAVNNPYVVLLNSDIAVSDDWLSPLFNYMNEHPDCGACQPKIRALNNPDMFEYAGASGGFLDKNGFPYCRGRLFDTVEEDRGQYDEPIPVFWASGAALMVRRDIYMEVGGLDADFFAHMEEIDLCWRIKLAGYDVMAIPSGKVYHLGGGTLSAANPRKTYLNYRNNLLLLHKNLPDSCRSKRLFIRRLYDSVAWLKFVMAFDFKNAKAILRAHRDFKSMRVKYRRHPEVNLLPAKLNVIKEYFLKRKCLFSSLPDPD